MASEPHRQISILPNRITSYNVCYTKLLRSPQITHKTDVGGLALNIRNRTEMESAYESMVEAVKTKSPRANIDGFLVQKMIGGGLEVILGAKRDPQFGPTILFGTGGIYTEVWKDIAYGIAPLVITSYSIHYTKLYE